MAPRLSITRKLDWQVGSCSFPKQYSNTVRFLRWIAPSAMRLYVQIVEDSCGGPQNFLEVLQTMPATKMIGFPLTFLSPLFGKKTMTMMRYRILMLAIEQAVQLRPFVMVFHLYSELFKLTYISISGAGFTIFETLSIMAVMLASNIFNKYIFQFVSNRNCFHFI